MSRITNHNYTFTWYFTITSFHNAIASSKKEIGQGEFFLIKHFNKQVNLHEQKIATCFFILNKP
jgi:hypothetical protein